MVKVMGSGRGLVGVLGDANSFFSVYYMEMLTNNGYVEKHECYILKIMLYSWTAESKLLLSLNQIIILLNSAIWRGLNALLLCGC